MNVVTAPLPVWRTVGSAYRMLWGDRRLLARAIAAPVVFLVTAEFLYHRTVGNAQGVRGHVQAVLNADWWMPLLVVAAWLAGLKFLLSFSISWRRRILFDDRFDSFFFHKPFWRYLGFLVLTYAWILPLVGLSLVPAGLLAARHASHVAISAAAILPAAAVLFAIWGVVRQVPFFTVLTFDDPRPGWRDCVRAMRGTTARYLAAFVLAMLPVVLANLALDTVLKLAGADRHSVHVALLESAFRQAMLFTHFALGAALGVLTTRHVLGNVQAPSMIR